LRPSVAAFGIYIVHNKENHIKTEGRNLENLTALSNHLWFVPWFLFAIVAFAGIARRKQGSLQGPLGKRMGQTPLARLAGPLPGDIALIAELGTQSGARESAGTLVMRTTAGLRLLSVGLSMALVVMMGGTGIAALGMPVISQPLFWVIAIFLAIGVLDVMTYELQFDRSGMVLTRFVFWRRSFDWPHLLGIDDDRNYHYVLAFVRGGRVKVMKHLVGMPQFLTLVADVLERNEARNAGTARG
jgi:hypothetical protein